MDTRRAHGPRRPRCGDAGAGLAEYALLIAAIGLVSVGVLREVDGALETSFVGLTAAVDDASPSAPTQPLGADAGTVADAAGSGSASDPPAGPAAIGPSGETDAPPGDPAAPTAPAGVPVTPDPLPTEHSPAPDRSGDGPAAPAGGAPATAVAGDTATVAPPPEAGPERAPKTTFRSSESRLQNARKWVAVSGLAVFGRDGELIPGRAVATIRVTKTVVGEDDRPVPILWLETVEVRDGVATVETKNLDVGEGKRRSAALSVRYDLVAVSQPGVVDERRWDAGMPSTAIAAPPVPGADR